jgi:DNA ligase (NAD+)
LTFTPERAIINYQIEKGIMKIEAPSNCPSCDSVLVWRNDTLFCINTDCSATSFKRIEHFAKTLKIKGLGPAAIQKLELNSINDIYTLTVPYMTVCLSSEKMAVKLFEQIEKSKNAQLNTVLPAFGIPLIGKTATEKLSQVCDSIDDLSYDICAKAGLGPKASENLMNWYYKEFPKYWDLPVSFEFNKKPSVQQTKGVICISGKLNSYKTKAEASSVLESLGYEVKSSITKDVTILVNESGRETDKTVKARNSGIQIVNNLKQLVEGN